MRGTISDRQFSANFTTLSSSHQDGTHTNERRIKFPIQRCIENLVPSLKIFSLQRFECTACLRASPHRSNSLILPSLSCFARLSPSETFYLYINKKRNHILTKFIQLRLLLAFGVNSPGTT